MRVYDVLGVAGSGLIFAVCVVCGACGGGAPDSTADAQGAATGAKAGVPTGSASGTAASAAPAGSSAPKSTTRGAASDAGAGRDAASTDPQAGDDDDNGLPGLPGKIGNGNDCCVNGKYFRCPDPTACFGGFDVTACIGKCGADVQCIEDCTSQLDETAAPKGCDANAAPPPDVDCELGIFQP
jgi:hypothetical protein